MWRAAARAAGIGNRLLTVMAGLLVFLMLTYGTSVSYTHLDVYKRQFLPHTDSSLFPTVMGQL